MQMIKTAFAVAAIGVAVLIGGGAPARAAPLSASPLASMSQPIAGQMDGGALQKVHYRRNFCWRHPHHWRCRPRGWRSGYCRNWRWRCADRWGWHTPRFRQCLRRHGC